MLKPTVLEAISKAAAFFESTLAKAGSLDIGASDKVEWIARWTSLIKHAQSLQPFRAKAEIEWQQVERGV
eukprot:230413-Pyramimonas_sp.AAC.2